MAPTHLQCLEAESIDIMRAAVSEAEKPVMLCSIGTDSSVTVVPGADIRNDLPPTLCCHPAERQEALGRRRVACRAADGE